jgi:hypothetical protein
VLLMTELTGGRRSDEILEMLARSRFGAIAADRASRTVGDLQWRPAQVGSIQRDDQRATWHSGNVQAVLSDGQAVIAGAQSGGVWLINPIPSPSYRDGYRAIPLSDRWDTPDVRSLAYGPDGTQHVFVGCYKADSLFLIELQAVTGALVVKQSDLRIPLPLRTTVNAIVIIDDPRRVVIGTSNGVFWSDVPLATLDVDSYVWKQASGTPLGPCGSIARGPATSLAASVSEPTGLITVNPIDSSDPDRLFVGDWRDGTLAFEPASVPDIATSQVYGFVLASCLTARERIYATAMNDEAMIRCVLRSDDGGRGWSAVTIPENAGEQGYHNRAIAVSPYRPDVVALGWQAAGPFLSTDGGAQWTLLSGGTGFDANGLPCQGQPQGLHSDLHALCFPLNALQADHLVVASDGGVVATRDLGRCFDSQYNRGLAVLQFYGPGHIPSIGTLSVSSRFAGLLAGGTQDNGNITLHPDADAGPVWHRLVGGDGGMTRFVDALGALLHASNGEQHVRMTTWNEAARRFDGPGSVVSRDGDPGGLVATALEAVVEPAWRRGGQLLYACAGSANGDVHGLFADADGAHAAFLRIANVGHSVSAIASLSGAEILVGCSDGRIISLETMSGLWTEQAQDADAPDFGGVTRFEVLSKNLAYALKRGQLLRFNGQSWATLAAAQGWLIFTVERETGRLFAASDVDVFSSADGGQTWVDASVGLPACPHCTDLRIGSDADGGSTLYLTTYGRSVWRARITLPPDKGQIFDLPPQARELLLRFLEDGGGVVRLGEQLIGIAAQQPALDILVGLVIDQMARRMSPESSREIRLATLQQIERAISRAIGALASGQ